tara:strand:- start:53 stop:634 length:582 start_codon:yes stop_codon:yes gene_type:complete
MNNETLPPALESIIHYCRFRDDSYKEGLIAFYNEGYSGKFATPSDLGRRFDCDEQAAFFQGKWARAAEDEKQAAIAAALEAQAQTPEQTAFSAKLDDLSDTAVIVLDALCKEVHWSTRGDFGFMEHARKDFLKIKISKHQFAGYVSALSDFIDWSVDLRQFPDEDENSIQFAVTSETYENRDLIEKRADALQR